MTGPTSATIDRSDVRGPQGQVVVEAVAPGRAATERLRTLISTLKDGAPLAPVTVVVRSSLTAIGLRRDLARTTAVAGIRIQTLAELTADHAPDLGPPLTPAIRHELVRIILDEDPGSPLGQVRHATATRRAVARSVRRLRAATVLDGDVLTALEGAGPLTDDLVRVFHRFGELSNGYADDEARQLALAARLTAGNVDLTAAGPVILHLPGPLAPVERELVRALARNVAVHALVPATGDPDVDAATRERVRRDLDADVAITDAPVRVPDLVVEAPDADEEARAAARRVLSQLADGAAAHRIAVLYRDDVPYASVLRDTFRRARIPFHGPDGRTLRDTPTGTSLVDLLRWSDEGYGRTGFLDWLHAAPVLVDGQAAPVRRWAELSAEANVTRHRRHWDRRLAALVRRAQDEAQAGSERSERFLELADEAGALRSFVLDLIARLRDPAERTWSGWSAWALDLIAHVCGPATDPDDARARELVGELAQLDAVTVASGTTSTVDRATFTQTLEERLDATTGTVGEIGRGVHVGPLTDAASLGFEHLILVGAIEGRFPPSPSDDPLLPDRVVEALGAIGAALTTRQDVLAAADLELATAVAAAADVTVTWSRVDRRQQRGQVPAPWLLDRAGKLAGLDRPLRVDELQGRTDAWYLATVSHQAGLSTRPALDVVDDRLATALTGDGEPATQAALHTRPTVARALRIERQRASEDFSVFDANIGPHPALDELLARPQSPTGLEAYGSCPRSYLFRRVLGVGSIEDTREPLTMSGRDRGSIVHEVLERYAQAIGDRDASVEERRHTMAELADEVLSDAEARWPVGRALLWQHEQREIRDQLRVVVDVETALRRRFGTEVTEPEVSVGDGPDDPDATEVELPSGRVLRFKGRIDRLDRDTDGTRTVIASDYKTGNTRGFRRMSEDPVANGTKLQAAIYALMAEHRHPQADVHAQYWAVNAGTHPGNATVGTFSLADQRDAILAAFDLVSEGIADGVFPATPGEWNDFRGTYDNCAYCPFDRICAAPGERERAWERDRRASETAPLRALHESRYLPTVDAGGDA